MSSSGTSPSAVTASLAKDRLGVFSVIMFAMTAAAPLLVVGGLVTEGWALTGVTGLPLAFVVHRHRAGRLQRRLRRDGPARHQRRRVLQLHRPRRHEEPRRRRVVRRAAGLQHAADRPLRRLRLLRAELLRREAALDLPLVGVRAGRLARGRDHGRAAGRHQQQDPRGPARGRDRGRDHLRHRRRRPPARRQRQPHRVRARTTCSSPASAPRSRSPSPRSPASRRHRSSPRRPGTPARPSRPPPTSRSP